MDTLRNPFAPGAGTPPPTLAGREDILGRSRLAIGRAKIGKPSKSFMLSGLRGVGKTVLLADAQNHADRTGCASLMINADEGRKFESVLAPGLYDVLLSLDRIEKAKKAGMIALKTFALFCRSFGMRINGAEFYLTLPIEHKFANSGILEADIIDLFEVVGAAAKEKETAVALIIDELHLLEKSEMSALIMAMHKVQQKSLPIVLIGGGLPQLRSLAGKAKTYAERLFDYPEIGSLEGEDAAKAVAEPIEDEGCAIQDSAVKEIVDQTRGYPFFLQVWGHYAWNIAKESPITKSDVASAHTSARQFLDENFFPLRMDRLANSEKDYIYAMAELGPGPYRSRDVAAKMGKGVEDVAARRSSLLKKGTIYSLERGVAAFTVPLFDEYLRRIQANAP